ncbi:hypothetical protein ABT160_28320 [Streptomyces sp. NPDC001941]|uniref:hypothetical protein n=1 Tax=Streptomyces sp. NPDC001941 TaxID=3154659 RepID=UPI00331D14DD
MSSTEPTHDTPRRRRPKAVVGAVAAAVLVAGGGAAYFATAASGEGAGGGTGTAAAGRDRPPQLALDGFTEGSGTSPGIAPGEPDPGGAAVYRMTGALPKGPASAPLYRADGTVGAAEVARLAKALGLGGTPRLEGGAWKVAGPSGAPALQVDQRAPGTWTYGPADGGCPSVTTCPDGSGEPVSPEAAERAAAPVLAAAGQSGAKLDTAQLMGEIRVVNADPVVGGLPTYGWSTGVQVGSDGRVVGASGQLKAPERADTYPVVGAKAALDALNASSRGKPVSIGGCATPGPLKGRERPARPCEPGGSVAPLPRTVTLDGAVFGLAAQAVGGRQALVPSWLFSVARQGDAPPSTITHPAVAPEFLAPKPPGSPVPVPSPTHTGLPDDGTRGRAIESYRVDGLKLTVTFWGGACSRYAATADERDDRVTVKVSESEPNPKRVCVMLAKEETATVELKQPLGSKRVVDASSGQAVPLKG